MVVKSGVCVIFSDLCFPKGLLCISGVSLHINMIDALSWLLCNRVDSLEPYRRSDICIRMAQLETTGYIYTFVCLTNLGMILLTIPVSPILGVFKAHSA